MPFIHGLIQPGIFLIDLTIYHLDLLINSEEKRRQKVIKYATNSIHDGLPHYYLPDIKHLNVEQCNYNDILYSVQTLLKKLPMNCKICDSESLNFANGKVLNKYDIDYFQCLKCGFVQTEQPYWLEEAYSEAIASSDVGLVFRNIMFSKICNKIIFEIFDHNAKFLDYGAGYGLFVRMMRDLGFDFYWHDKFCKNIFAQGFDANKHNNDHYELVSAFEVFEHFINPIDEIKQILKFSRNILFSTELLPPSNPKPNEWWYYVPHEGQHISIYTINSLSIIAKKFNLNLYSNGSSLHLLTEKKLPPLLFDSLSHYEPQELKKRSLLQEDYLKTIDNFHNSNSNSFITATNDSEHSVTDAKGIRVVLDGVFFQLYKTGIARVWSSLLEEWAENGFAKHIVVLDRAGTAPAIPGISYRSVPPYEYGKTDADREMLQQVCDEEAADLFISTYYTTPLSTSSVFMAYDMIPEVMEWDLNHSMWQEKHYAIQHASGYMAISENTARDLVKFFPDISSKAVTVAPCGVKSTFSPASLEEVNSFKTKYGISKPYFILVGTSGYKNTTLFFKAFAHLYSRQGFEIVCTGSGWILEAEFRNYTSGSVVHILQLSDEELKAAYSGAVALVYPSKYEGFGLPVLEAIACGCSVITCPNASIPEVAGEAALYVNDDDVDGLVNALCEVQKPSVRNSLIAAGLEQAKKFSWSKMAKTVGSALIDATLLPLNLKDINLIVFPNWSQPEESLCFDLQQVIRAIATHPNRSQITLLVNTGNISEEDAALILSSVTMNLLLQEDLDVSEGPEISLVGQLSEIQWTALLLRIHAQIVLENENDALKAIKPNCRADQLPFNFDIPRIHQSLLNDHLKFLIDSPRYFQEIGEAENYYYYMEQWVNYLHSNIFSNPESKLWKDVALAFTEKTNFGFLYFTDTNLKDIYAKRADIIEFALKASGHQIDYSFPVSLERNKIRIGILAADFTPHTETFATLPVYQHLNRDLFEISLYTIQSSNHRIERYCWGHADAFITLPQDLPSQVQAIRDGDLDILFISRNVTAVAHSITLLALHRLARLQIVGMNSPVTTGMRNVDYYISSKLVEDQNEAQQQYTETLITLDSPAQCFDFATEEQLVSTNSINRDLGIDKNTVVYISGANFYKILPELEVTWARIIAGVANSKLLLYPFNPNWSSSYPDIAFRKRLTATFARHGLSEDRLSILDPVPNIADVKERLKIGEIYLDSYPYSGMTSLIDPLQLGIPTVVLEGNSSRSRMGASLLREIQIPDLIADNEESYIQLAIALGTNPEVRKQKSEQIKQRMQANPRFLDSRSYSAQMGTLFQELFRKHQAIALTENLKLRDINLILFPDWSLPEDILYQELASVITSLVKHPDKNQMTLLINTANLSEDEANLFLSDVVMNLLLEENLDVTDGLEISLLGHLSEIQWTALLPRIHARISLENENQEAMPTAWTSSYATVKAETIPSYEIHSLSKLTSISI